MQSDDMTYHFSSVALLASAELACGILVFSIPVIPKAFVGMKVPNWVPSLRFWEGSAVRDSQDRRPRNMRSGLATSWPGNYRNIEEGNGMIVLSKVRGAKSEQKPRDGPVGLDDPYVLPKMAFTEDVPYELSHPRL